jgi:uncharacterized membrane protein
VSSKKTQATETAERKSSSADGVLAPSFRFLSDVVYPLPPRASDPRPHKEKIIMEQTQLAPAGRMRLSTFDLAVAGIFGALAIVLAFTPLGLIPVPNPTEAATSLHLPAIVAGILSGPVVGGLVGLVLALSSWYLYGATFITFTGGNLLVALLAAFLPRILIGVLAYYAYRSLRRWPTLAAAVAGLVGTLTNTVGVLGILIGLGTLPVALLVPVFTMNVPIEVALALIVTIPVVAALRATGKGRIAAEQD